MTDAAEKDAITDEQLLAEVKYLRAVMSDASTRLHCAAMGLSALSLEQINKMLLRSESELGSALYNTRHRGPHIGPIEDLEKAISASVKDKV